MADTAVVWFRDDLRLHDNATLARAVAEAETVVPLYVFDPRTYGEGMFGLPKRGPYWAAFRREAVLNLRSALRDRDGDLLVRHGDPQEVVPEVSESFDAEVVYAQTKPATEEWETENAVRARLAEREVPFERSWTHTLYHLEDLPTPYGRMDDTFTPWRKEVEREASVRSTRPAPDAVPAVAFEAGDVPTLDDLGVEGDPTPDERRVLAFEGGETAGRRRVREYLWEGDHLRNYKATRNGLLGPDYSSKLSAWLAHGCLSPRYVYEEVKRYEDERVANEDTYWLVFELLWRDFFQFQFCKHEAAFFAPDGIRGVGKRWRRDREAFRRWADGETGVPFVDANVRELNATGYMSNRGRQNVASFLADFLEVDWRMGAAYFESRLVDYDVASNWGNWAYQAGVGNDSRDSYFYVPGQAERYDPEAEYVTHWLPELEPLSPAAAHHPWRMSESEAAEYGVQLGIDYPEPVIDPDARYDEMRRGR
jgi:deoxyribodipyrimidine photo-lyase